MKNAIIGFLTCIFLFLFINGEKPKPEGVKSYVPYQSGGFTPTIAASGGTLPTFSVASGTYTQYGRLVFFNIALENVSGGTSGNGSQQLSISLPFTTGTNQLTLKVPVGSVTNGTTEDVLYAEIVPNSSTMTLWVQTVGLGSLSFSILNCGYFNNLNTRKIQLMGKILIN